MFAGNFAPRSWALCDGQLLAISQNDALFSLVGTIYGGDGRTTFGLPDLRGRLPVHLGTGFNIGQQAGAETVTVTPAQLPAHSHGLQASADQANSPNPAGHVLAETVSTTPYYAGAPAVSLAPQSVTNAGGSQSHDNVQPFLCVNYIISLFGIYPSRN